MQLTGSQAINFGWAISSHFCLIIMSTNFLDICIRGNMIIRNTANFMPKRAKRAEWSDGGTAEVRKGQIVERLIS